MNDTTRKIAELNDLCRTAMGVAGQAVQIAGISALPFADQSAIREKVETFDGFTPDYHVEHSRIRRGKAARISCDFCPHVGPRLLDVTSLIASRCMIRAGETGAASIHEDEAVVLVIRVSVVVVFQLEVTFLKLHPIRRERTIVGHFVDALAIPVHSRKSWLDLHVYSAQRKAPYFRALDFVQNS